ncbi:MAG TPA: cell division protein FtsQ/DivIB [Acidiferrobacter sp.]|nr:cell division protein FtsQ/DivIB [Acidiferrobacter sp.]
MRASATMRMRSTTPRVGARLFGVFGRLRKPYVLAAALLLGLTVLALLLRAVLAPGRFPVRVIRLVGNLQGIPHQRLVSAIAPFMRENFYALDLGAVGQAVSQVPWVGSVRVERRFPRTLVVQVRRETLTAKWALGGWVNTAGAHVHLQGDHPPQNLPVFSGPAGHEADMIAHYADFQALLHPLGLTIATLTLSARQTWRIGVYKGPVLVLGHAASAHLLRFAHVFPQIATSLASMRQVDLRYTNGFAISWNEATGDQHGQKG